MNKLKNCLEKSRDCIYIVEEGDNLLSISKKLNVPINLIIKDNNLSGEVATGQFLYIYRNGKTYTIKVEDTLDKIADKFGVFKDDIKKINKIEYLYPGEIIVIPTKENYEI